MTNEELLKSCQDFFNRRHFTLQAIGEYDQCWECTVNPTPERIVPMTPDELKEFIELVQGICVDVRMEGDKAYTWAVFYTTLVD